MPLWFYLSKSSYCRVWLGVGGRWWGGGISACCWAELDLSTPPSAGVRQQNSVYAGCVCRDHPFSTLFGCRDSAWVQVQEHKFRPTERLCSPLQHSQGFCCCCSVCFLAFLIHKAAACKWAKTLSKSWRSKSHQHSSCSIAVLRTLHWKHWKWSEMRVLIQPVWNICPCFIDCKFHWHHL